MVFVNFWSLPLKKHSFLSIFSPFFLVFRHDLISCFDFTCIAASNAASDGVTNQVTHRIFNTDLLHSCTHFVVEINEIYSRNGMYYYDLMMLSDSGLLIWPTLYIRILILNIMLLVLSVFCHILPAYLPSQIRL